MIKVCKAHASDALVSKALRMQGICGKTSSNPEVNCSLLKARRATQKTFSCFVYSQVSECCPAESSCFHSYMCQRCLPEKGCNLLAFCLRIWPGQEQPQLELHSHFLQHFTSREEELQEGCLGQLTN
eukprot:Skav218791  [mRNA]  locus=scaffold1140:154794:155174:+ [translate_table: standard]